VQVFVQHTPGAPQADVSGRQVLGIELGWELGMELGWELGMELGCELGILLGMELG